MPHHKHLTTLLPSKAIPNLLNHPSDTLQKPFQQIPSIHHKLFHKIVLNTFTHLLLYSYTAHLLAPIVVLRKYAKCMPIMRNARNKEKQKLWKRPAQIKKLPIAQVLFQGIYLQQGDSKNIDALNYVKIIIADVRKEL